MLRGISPTAQDKFVKLPARQPEAGPASLVEASLLPSSLPEGGPQSELSALEEKVEELQALIATMGPAAHYGGPARILRVVSKFYGQKISDIKGPSRRREHVVPRHHAAWRMAIECGHMSTTAIGCILGVDHTTILYAWRNWPYLAGIVGIDPYAWPPQRIATMGTRR